MKIMTDLCPNVATAWSLLQERMKNADTIITFCEKLDRALGGGIHLGHITELAGPASIGKTQICFQLAVDVQFPTDFAGVAGHAVFIDTECSFKSKRLEEIAKAAVRHINDIADSPGNYLLFCPSLVHENYLSAASFVCDCRPINVPLLFLLELKAAAEKFTVDSVLNSVYVKRCLDLLSLVSTIHELDRFLLSHPKVKLVVVDSFAFHFRDDQLPVRDRRRLLLKTILTLAKLASTYNVAVVAVNQMTTKFTVDGEGFEEPALSEMLTQNVGDQIILGWRKKNSQSDTADVERCAVLYKSSHSKRAFASYQISACGIRDI